MTILDALARVAKYALARLVFDGLRALFQGRR